MGSAGRHDISTFLGLLDGATHMPLLNPWACFLDESGKFQDTEIVSIGVCVIRAEEVQPLTEKWASVLERNNLPFTSMKEAVNFKGPYFDWKSNPGKRDEVLRALAQVLIDARIGCLAGTAPSARFDTLSNAEKEKLWKNLYYPIFEVCVIGCLGHARSDIRLICDLAEEYSETCVRLFNLLRKKRSDVKARCFGIAFNDDEVTPCLQMADMIAYCGRTNESSYIRVPIVDELASLLYSTDRKEGKVLYRMSSDGLGDAELIWEGIQNALPSNQ